LKGREMGKAMNRRWDAKKSREDDVGLHILKLRRVGVGGRRKFIGKSGEKNTGGKKGKSAKGTKGYVDVFVLARDA